MNLRSWAAINYFLWYNIHLLIFSLMQIMARLFTASFKVYTPNKCSRVVSLGRRIGSGVIYTHEYTRGILPDYYIHICC